MRRIAIINDRSSASLREREIAEKSGEKYLKKREREKEQVMGNVGSSLLVTRGKEAPRGGEGGPGRG